MQILSLEQAEAFTGIGKESLRKLAKEGNVQAAYIAERWLFVDVDLVDWVRSHYNDDRKGKSQGKELETCSAKETVAPIGTTNLRLVEKQYSELLGQPTKGKPKK